MHQISFGGRPGPAGGAYSAPPSPSCIKGCLLLREERGEKWGRGGGERVGAEGIEGEGGRSGARGKGEYASLALGGWTPLSGYQQL